MSDPSPDGAPAPPVPDALRVQILATEHWSLLATRTMTWNEIFTRAGMFLSTVSAAVVALALIAQATGFDERFRVFALVVLPVVLLLGIATLIRLGDAMEEDVWLLVGMNRLRHAYLDLAPDLEPYFVTGHHDDASTLARRFDGESRIRPSRVLAGTPVIVAIIDAVLAGVLTAVLASTLIDRLAIYASGGAVVEVACAVVLAGIYPYRSISRLRREYQPRFPRPADAERDG